jgi:adenylate cyclase
MQPIMLQTHAASDDAHVQAHPGTEPIHILIVDDDECIRELIDLYLHKAGYRITLAEDAIQAGQYLLQNTPDLMITDVDMPYLNGLKFVSAIRADRTIPFFPVIFLSARNDIAKRAWELGAACLSKPVLPDRLLDVVGAYARNRSA